MNKIHTMHQTTTGKLQYHHRPVACHRCRSVRAWVLAGAIVAAVGYMAGMAI